MENQTQKQTQKQTKLNEDDLKYINAILLNDENSTDNELIKLFCDELKINQKLSLKIVSFRNNALININFDIRDFLK